MRQSLHAAWPSKDSPRGSENHEAGLRNQAAPPEAKNAKLEEVEVAMRWCAMHGRSNLVLLKHLYTAPECITAARTSTDFQIAMLAFLTTDVVDLPDPQGAVVGTPTPIPRWQLDAIEAIAHEDVLDCLGYIHPQCVRCRFKFSRLFIQVHGLTVKGDPEDNPFYRYATCPSRPDFNQLRRAHSKSCDERGRKWSWPMLKHILKQ
eukprot:TRINITY_DN3651_c0_g1_i3.p1 TRINITY_DN3651_c0_g1~~TRINITY_DN3651_c0_g1_i3.p1  ORF type:complete len:205 (+),score=39.00 TRINITY_DN3651_c0_g1_i3:46-660(+)